MPNKKFSIGNSLKELRNSLNITLDVLSKKCGLSKSYLSLIERDQANPSIATLKRITDALNKPLTVLFESEYISNDKIEYKKDEDTGIDKNVYVIKENERKKLRYPKEDLTIQLLSPNLNRKIEFTYMIARPGQNSGKGYYTHEGEECGIVIEGAMKYTVNYKEYILNKGDTIYFNSILPHKWEVLGNKRIVTVWANTPPSF